MMTHADYVDERTLEIATYMARTGCTIREASKAFTLSKSTLHKDVTQRLRTLNVKMHKEIQELLLFHKSIRHLRGGAATGVRLRGKPRKDHINIEISEDTECDEDRA